MTYIIKEIIFSREVIHLILTQTENCKWRSIYSGTEKLNNVPLCVDRQGYLQHFLPFSKTFIYLVLKETFKSRYRDWNLNRLNYVKSRTNLTWSITITIFPEIIYAASYTRVRASCIITSFSLQCLYLFIYLFIICVFKTLSNDETMGKEAALKCYSDTSVKEIGKATENLMYKPSLGRDFNPGCPVFEAWLLPTGSQSLTSCDEFYASVARPSPILNNPLFAILLSLFCLRYLSSFVAMKGAKTLKHLDLFNCRLSCILCQIFGCW